MKHTLRLVAAATSSLVIMLGFVQRAAATEEFPSEIYYHLYSSYHVAPYHPPCSLCHLRGSTGDGTAQTPFALSMKAHGLQPEDGSSLTAALDALNRENVDSDCDGTPDIQEIEIDSNPNTPAPVSLASDTGPNAGCGGGQKENFAGGKPASVVGLAGSLVLLLWRQRPRRLR